MFLGKAVLKIFSKFTGEICKLLCNFMEITLLYKCSPVKLLRIFKTHFPTNSSGGLLVRAVTGELRRGKLNDDFAKNHLWFYFSFSLEYKQLLSNLKKVKESRHFFILLFKKFNDQFFWHLKVSFQGMDVVDHPSQCFTWQYFFLDLLKVLRFLLEFIWQHFWVIIFELSLSLT